MAKGNNHQGMRFIHHESGEEIKLSGLKAIKNRYCGFYLHGSYNVTLQGSLFAENSHYDVDLKWSDNVEIKDAVFRGYTSETRALLESPYFNRPCETSNFLPPVGLRLPLNIHKWDSKDNIGAILTNVLFTDFDHSDECADAIPISFNSHDVHHNHFNYLSMLRNVTIDGSKFIDAEESSEDGVKDIVIHDIDGSSNPLKSGLDNINGSAGQMSQPGMWVSNVRWLKAFAGDCQNYPHGISYCANSW